MSPPEPGVVRFVVLAVPRSGSNWLCTLLDSHPDVLCHHELFNPAGIHLARSCREAGAAWADLGERERDPAGFLRRALDDARGARAVGFKLNRGQSPEAFAAVFGDPSLRKLLLFRRNRVKAYVSERLAERSGRWEAYTDSPEPDAPGPLEVDAGDLARHAEANRRYLHELATELAREGQDALVLSYEELDEPDTHRRLLAFLGVRADVALHGGTHKQTPADLRRVIANFPALAQSLAGGELEPELHSSGP